jgi:hypothetical protein
LIMRNRINSSAGPDSWLAALARRLRDWLNHYLGEDESLAGEGGRAESAREREHDTAPSPALEHWLDLVRNAAPELLIPPEEGGTPWLYAGQLQDTGNWEEMILPENHGAAEASRSIATSPRGPQPAKGNEKLSPAVERRPAAPTAVPQPGPRTANQPPGRPPDQTKNAALSRTGELRSHAGSSSQVDITTITTNEATQVPPPPFTSVFERKERGRQVDGMKKEISPKELPIQASLQPDVTSDTGSARPPVSSGFHSVPRTRSAMENREVRVLHPADFTTLQAPFKASNRAPELVRGSNRNETVERPRNVNLDSAGALSGHHVVANQPSSKKQPRPLSLQVKPLLPQAGFNEAGAWPVLPKSEQHGNHLLPAARQRPDTAESTGDRRPLFTRSAGDGPVVMSNLKAESPSDLWPELPEGPPLEDIDDTQFVPDLQHVQALDLEQGGH